MDGGEPPSLDPAKNGHVTELFVQLQTCKDFSVSPLEYFVGKDAKWKDYPHLKLVMFAFRLLLNEEETRRIKEIKTK
jgi:hypothetical protein